MRYKNTYNFKNGFTIIEVLIVLVVAGVIFSVVFLAVPQLQRNQRNEARKEATNRIYVEVRQFAANNKGNFPNTTVPAVDVSDFGKPGDAVGFFNRYLKCNTATPPECFANIDDPSSGQPLGSGSIDGNAITTTIMSDGSQPGIVPGSLGYGTGLRCDGEVARSTSDKLYIIMVRLEGGAVYCVDEKTS